jgi:hypothetical protein
MIHDIALILVGYNRPDLIEARLNEISKLPILKLYINIDFSSKEMTEKMENIISDFVEKHGRNIKIKSVFQNKNLGLNDHIIFSINNCLAKNENFILVEDDIKLSSNFYLNMVNGFNLQSRSQELGYIGAFSPLNLKTFPIKKNYWRKTIYFSCWGWGTNKNTWRLYKENLGLVEINKELSKSKSWESLNRWQKYLWLHRFRKIQMNPKMTWDIQFQYMSFVNDFYNIVPVNRIIDNEGYSDTRASHTIENKPFWFKNGFADYQIESKVLPESFSKLFNRIVDSNTVAGDGRLTRLYLSLSKFRYKFTNE